jgi:hypothetical protein
MIFIYFATFDLCIPLDRASNISLSSYTEMSRLAIRILFKLEDLNIFLQKLSLSFFFLNSLHSLEKIYSFPRVELRCNVLLLYNA